MNCFEIVWIEYERTKSWNAAIRNLSNECREELGYPYTPIKELEDWKKEDRRKGQRKYAALCRMFTARVCHMVSGNDKRRFRQYDLDHIIPISYGYKNKIPPWYIGSLENLQVIAHKKNWSKGQKLTNGAKRLLTKWGYPT